MAVLWERSSLGSHTLSLPWIRCDDHPVTARAKRRAWGVVHLPRPQVAQRREEPATLPRFSLDAQPACPSHEQGGCLTAWAQVVAEGDQLVLVVTPVVALSVPETPCALAVYPCAWTKRFRAGSVQLHQPGEPPQLQPAAMKNAEDREVDVCCCQRPAATCWRVRAHYPRSHSGLPTAPGYPCHCRAWPPLECAPFPVPVGFRCRDSPSLCAICCRRVVKELVLDGPQNRHLERTPSTGTSDANC